MNAAITDPRGRTCRTRGSDCIFLSLSCSAASDFQILRPAGKIHSLHDIYNIHDLHCIQAYITSFHSPGNPVPAPAALHALHALQYEFGNDSADFADIHAASEFKGRLKAVGEVQHQLRIGDQLQKTGSLDAEELYL